MPELIPRIVNIPQKKLVGMQLSMSLEKNRTGELWAGFMPRKNAIPNRISGDLISMQIYPENYYTDFHPETTFEKWAAIEVSEFNSIPDKMETFVMPSGLYAVFDYKGSSANNQIFQYIFGTWLPKSHYILDSRPHFEVLGNKYKNNDPNSEEEIWIPVKLKQGLQ